MRLEPTMKQAVIRRTVRRFGQHRLAQAAVEMDTSGRFSDEVAQRMAELQYFGLEASDEYGGAGLDPISYAIVIEEVSRANAAMGLCIAVHNGVAVYPLINFGNEGQIGRFLQPMATGESIGTFCLTEPNAGSDPSSLETSAQKSGTGYLLNGNKVFVTNGGISKINLIFAAMNGSGTKRTFSVFLVESSRHGLLKGPQEELMGMRGNPVCPISLHDCWVPEENLLGGEGRGLKVALETLNGGRIGIAAQSLGIAQACLDVSLKYAGERRQFGRSISSFGAVQNMLADTATRIEAARLLTYRACHFKASGGGSSAYSAMAKLNASETAVEAARVAVQIHGGYGYTKAYPVERYYRDAKVCEIYEGTSEVQRMVIARALLGR
ncbi:MAG: acyl-CoA dehydrogenase family protein [Desulfatiglandaceae bacterium]